MQDVHGDARCILFGDAGEMQGATFAQAQLNAERSGIGVAFEEGLVKPQALNLQLCGGEVEVTARGAQHLPTGLNRVRRAKGKIEVFNADIAANRAAERTNAECLSRHRDELGVPQATDTKHHQDQQ